MSSTSFIIIVIRHLLCRPRRRASSRTVGRRRQASQTRSSCGDFVDQNGQGKSSMKRKDEKCIAKENLKSHRQQGKRQGSLGVGQLQEELGLLYFAVFKQGTNSGI